MIFERIKGIVKKTIPFDSTIYQLLSSIINYGEPRQLSLEEYLNEFAISQPEVGFMQIGSNDGKSSDPIFPFVMKFNWKGILIEPTPHLFKKLQQNYQSQKNNLKFENLAIGDESGEQTFYSISKSFDSDIKWANQLGSLDKNVILKHSNNIEGIEEHIEEIIVPVLTVEDVLDKHKDFLKKIDLIHIDAEGYDYYILMSIDFNVVKPRVLIFEHMHMSKMQRKTLNKLLKKNGYKLYWDRNDTFGVTR